MFELDLAPADPILGLTEAFKSDTHPDKINLGVGVYQDNTGKTPILESVKLAEKQLLIIISLSIIQKKNPSILEQKTYLLQILQIIEMKNFGN